MVLTYLCCTGPGTRSTLATVAFCCPQPREPASTEQPWTEGKRDAGPRWHGTSLGTLLSSGLAWMSVCCKGILGVTRCTLQCPKRLTPVISFFPAKGAHCSHGEIVMLIPISTPACKNIHAATQAGDAPAGEKDGAGLDCSGELFLVP